MEMTQLHDSCIGCTCLKQNCSSSLHCMLLQTGVLRQSSSKATVYSSLSVSIISFFYFGWNKRYYLPVLCAVKKNYACYILEYWFCFYTHVLSAPPNMVYLVNKIIYYHNVESTPHAQSSADWFIFKTNGLAFTRAWATVYSRKGKERKGKGREGEGRGGEGRGGEGRGEEGRGVDQ